MGVSASSASTREAALVLEDGSVFIGSPFGADVDTAGEVVFNTGMTGYQEIATDPSYRGQLVVMTHPQIGNYGISATAEESRQPWISALIVRELAVNPNHWESRGRLEEYLARWCVPGLQGIDTRALVRRLRQHGMLRGVLCRSGAGGFSAADLAGWRAKAVEAPSVSERDLVGGVSGVLPDSEAMSSVLVAVLDCGTKWNIVHSLERRGVRPRVYPWNATAEEILSDRPRALVVSNGPGDPARLPAVVGELQRLIASGIPTLGICLGHQLIALSAGATTSRLRYGHHGGNHPVKDLATGRVTITTQNHEFQVDAASLREASGFDVSQVNLNDGSVEGLRHRELPVVTVQFHPEGNPGPQDSQRLFDGLLAQAGIGAGGSLKAGLPGGPLLSTPAASA